MRLAHVLYKKSRVWGAVEGNCVRLLRDGPFAKIKLSRKKIGLDRCVFLPPADPSKIVLVGLNYKNHAKELGMDLPGNPLIFLKPNTALTGHLKAIIYPNGIGRLDYEAELAIVIGKKAKSVSAEKAKKYILGYTCLNDVTARELQKKDIQWTRSKSFDTFCPLGPWLETEMDPSNVRVKLYLNGALKQDSSTSNFIFPAYYLVSFISKIMTLLPGDIIATGTPPGVGPMQKGDTVEVEIEKIGRLVNYVR